jgi:hypothetical protein
MSSGRGRFAETVLMPPELKNTGLSRYPISEGGRGEPRCSSGTGCTSPVSYVLPRNLAPKSANFPILNSLFTLTVSTLPRPPGYSVDSLVNCPDSNRAGYSPAHPVRNWEGDSDGYLASHVEGCLPENPAGNWEDCVGRNSAGCSADCPCSRPGRNPASNLRSNEIGYLPHYSESNRADSLPYI